MNKTEESMSEGLMAGDLRENIRVTNSQTVS